MLKVISFQLTGYFAAFRDPSVTTSQSVYNIPSKSAVIGLIGALVGIQRDNTLGSIYGPDFIDLLKKTRIGISLQSNPQKTVFFTNHRSLKKPKTKPFKTELLVSPTYTIYIQTEDDIEEKLTSAIKTHNFAYPPYLGHAYCPARISDFQTFEADLINGDDQITSSVILDESETFDNAFDFSMAGIGDESRIIIERHLHHFVQNGNLEQRVLKHWIPVAGSEFRTKLNSTPKLSVFIKNPQNKVACLY